MIEQRKVYFALSPKLGLLKIGKSGNVDKRLVDLQVSSAEVLELLLVMVEQAPFEERQLHWRFRGYQAHGEWFEYRGELKKFVAEKRANPAATVADDLALAGEKSQFTGQVLEGYREARQDNRVEHRPECSELCGHTDENCRFPNTLMKSPAYGIAPVWNNQSTSQEFWNEVSNWWATCR